MLEAGLTRGTVAECPQRMPAGGAGATGPVRCVRCGAPILPGELFLPAGRCAMGGVVTGPGSALYTDVLEPAGEHVRCAAAACAAASPRCYTVGHGTRSLDEFVALLREYEIGLVVDIRTVPKSRHNPQFAGEALARTLPEAGCCTLHLPALGGLRRPLPDSPNGGWRNPSFRGYADYMQTPAFEAALAELIALLRWQRTAIMCAETVYWRCHRSLVADALLVRGIPSLHLMSPGKATPNTLTRFARVDGTRLTYPPEDSSAGGGSPESEASPRSDAK